MKNIVFVIWMVTFPISVPLGDYLIFLAHGSVTGYYSEQVQLFVAIFEIILWLLVGYLLYETPVKVVENK
jgi:hypothetical protein